MKHFWILLMLAVPCYGGEVSISTSAYLPSGLCIDIATKKIAPCPPEPEVEWVHPIIDGYVEEKTGWSLTTKPVITKELVGYSDGSVMWRRKPPESTGGFSDAAIEGAKELLTSIQKGGGK